MLVVLDSAYSSFTKDHTYSDTKTTHIEFAAASSDC